MSFIKEIFGLAEHSPTQETEAGKIIPVGEEETAIEALKHHSDDGKYLQFELYFPDIKSQIVDIDHINRDTYFCVMIKLGLLQKRGSSYLPPEEIYQQMKGSNGEEAIGLYRKKSNTSGTTFGFNYENVGTLNTEWKGKIVDLMQDVEDKLDIAWEEANEIAELLKERHRADPTKRGKPSVFKKRDALFTVSKAEILHEILGC